MNTKHKQIAREQYSKLVNLAADLTKITQPKEGWIKTVRSALNINLKN